MRGSVDRSLTLEPGEPIRISGKRFRQDLQHDLPIQLGIGGLIDLAHAALADEGGDVVVAELGADIKSHEGVASFGRETVNQASAARARQVVLAATSAHVHGVP